MVKLFKMNNFVVGVGFVKSEVLMVVILGVMFFGFVLLLLGWIGVFIGVIVVLLLSGIVNVKYFNLGIVLFGFVCGILFVFLLLWICEVSLNLGLIFLYFVVWVLVLIISL